MLIMFLSFLNKILGPLYVYIFLFNIQNLSYYILALPKLPFFSVKSKHLFTVQSPTCPPGKLCRKIHNGTRTPKTAIGEQNGKSFKGVSKTDKKRHMKIWSFITQFKIEFLLWFTSCRKVLGKMPAEAPHIYHVYY